MKIILQKHFLIVTLITSQLFFAQREIQVTGNGSNIVNGTTTISATNNTNFGQFDINAGNKSITYTITNVGNGQLQIGSPAVTFGAGSSAAFSIALAPANNSNVAAGNSVTFTINFNPANVTVYNAVVVINNNDQDESPFTFAIQGEGVLIYPDTDLDGISNNIDVDDDNDGLRDAVEQTTCLAISTSSNVSLTFLNENFGAGQDRVRINGTTPGVTTNYPFEDGTSAQAVDEVDTDPSLNDGEYTVHYSITDNSNPTNISSTGPDTGSWADQYWSNVPDHTPGDSFGRMAIFNASNAPGEFYKTTIQGILPGVPLNYSFWVVNIDANDAAFSNANRIKPNITVNFWSSNGVTLLHTFNTGDITRCTSGNSCVTSLWKNFTTTTTLNVASFIIQLVNNSPGGGGNDLAIDDILITQTLCDSDGDGISDIIDLDNDNDGLPNILEYKAFSYSNAAINFDNDKNATFGGTGFVDSNGNGLHDLVESGLNPVDTDGDGIKDYLDLDSDNDGVFDVDEYDGFGDIDINADGLGNGNDIATAAQDDFDGDGILGIMDDNDTDADDFDHGTFTYPTPLDSDNDGIPNYLDVINGSVTDISATIYANLDANNNGIIDGSGDLDKDGLLDIFDTNDNRTGSPRLLNAKYSVAFDGRNDYIEETITGTDLIQGKNKTTIMAWVKLASNYTGYSYIAGQKNFKMAINANRQLEGILNNSTFTNNTFTLPFNKWVHVAMVFDGVSATKKLNLYVNGTEVSNNTSITTITTDVNKNFTMGRNPDNTATLGYFNGEIDEVRVYDAVFNADQVQKLVYQELDATDFTKGAIIPMVVPGVAANMLLKYYRMDAVTDDVLDNLTTPATDITGIKLYNIKKIQNQTAPMPYQTADNGSWTNIACWKNENVQDIASFSNLKPWSIIEIKHNINLLGNLATNGLMIDANKTLKVGDATNSYKVENYWFLNLNGKLDLENQSQLIQSNQSVLNIASNGSVEIDQQGTKNSFTYNYFSSPVGPITNAANNGNYTIGAVLKDGTTASNPQTPNFQALFNAADGAQTNPVTLSTRWMYKFANTPDNYSNWTLVRSNGAIKAGEGFSMKGTSNTGVLQNTQNYVFVGKPNNGDINLTIAANNAYLVGNPYPSAINANTFINDNTDLTGVLYFWQHYGGGSHILAQYQGGYAALNAIGGVPAVAETTLTSGTINPAFSKTPQQYIPVGQGFFVNAKPAVVGATVKFKNSQRPVNEILRLETTGTSVFIRQQETQDNNNTDTREKIRLGIQINNYNRQLLVGVDNNTTFNYEDKYDAENYDDVTTDASWLVENKKLVIQGVPNLNTDAALPLQVKATEQGNVTFNIDGLENTVANKKVYLKDTQNNVYHDLTINNYTTQIVAGENSNRFSLVFQTPTALNSEAFSAIENEIQIYGATNSINLFNNSNKTIDNLEVFDINGRSVFNQKINNNQNVLNINTNLSAAVYLVKLSVENTVITKKIVIAN